MKDKFYKYLLVIIFIILFLLIVISYGSAMNLMYSAGDLGAYTLIISFLGLFATFGGSYIGAKISGEAAIEAVEKQINEQKNENIIKSKIRYLETLNKVTSDINKANVGGALAALTIFKWFDDNELIISSEEMNNFYNAKEKLEKFIDSEYYLYLTEIERSKIIYIFDLLDKTIETDSILQRIVPLGLTEKNKALNKHKENFEEYLKLLNNFSDEIMKIKENK
ncbi:hypothetical protein ERX37_04905 [Macrococcus hajekii]|uniref:Uncharacterized protein n=1 Tax=Macrococcus hajekii TaxID=198482 RepID=A0A4R6BNJ4_9STAP|nr:hypothetical protein [Macrococcus hajekii]TDM03426.1 hypothetical protein ERX37_04905 [Macrococcus hajekii]GGA98772.1 hypothetical protein GCM10007190_03470 [Macrococcus hajekii]